MNLSSPIFRIPPLSRLFPSPVQTLLAALALAALPALLLSDSASAQDDGPPEITAGPVIISSPADGDTYAAKETILVAFSWSEPVAVTVNPDTGGPRVRLTIGDRERWARYERSEQERTRLIFAYVVRNNDADSDGVSIRQNRLQLAGGSITDDDGNNARRKHPALSVQAGHKVEGSSSEEGPEPTPAPPANSEPQFAADTDVRSVAENTPTGENVGGPVSALDDDGDTLTYALAGPDAGAFDFDPGTGQIRVQEALDYEGKASYAVTVTVHDGKNADGEADATVDDSIAVTIDVNNVDEEGGVSLLTDAGIPEVESPVGALLLDPDDGLTGVTWAWERSSDGTAWEAIEGADESAYTPSNDDAGYYLRVTAFYADGHGPGKSAQTATDTAVVAPAEAPPQEQTIAQTKPTLVLSPAEISEDGGSATVTATLDEAATAQTTITISTAAVPPAAATDFTQTGTTLTIADGATASAGAVTIAAVDNQVDAMDQSVTVSGVVSGNSALANPDDVTLTITDDDTRGVTVSKAALSIAEGGSGTYTIALDSEPTADVTITPSSDNTDVTFAPATLTFTPSDFSAREVTVSGAADTDTTDDTATITHTVTGGDYGANSVTAASVTVTVTESAQTPGSPSNVSILAGDAALTVTWLPPTGAEGYDLRHRSRLNPRQSWTSWTVVEDIRMYGPARYVLAGLTNGRSYEVQVRATKAGRPGSWSSSASGTPREHDHRATRATQLPLNFPIGGEISPGDDLDAFEITLSDPTSILIYTRGAFDTRGTLWNIVGARGRFAGNPVEIESNDHGELSHGAGNFLISRYRLPVGTYYVTVRGQGDETGPYVLETRTIADTTGRSDAQEVELDHVAEIADGVIFEEDDEDFFEFTLTEDTTVVVRGTRGIAGELLDNAGARVTGVDTIPLHGSGFAWRAALSAGTYYIKVSGALGLYSLSVAAVGEPGNTLAQARQLRLSRIDGGTIDPAGDADYFSVTLPSDTFVWLSAAGVDADLSGALLDENGDTVVASLPSLASGSRQGFTFRGRLDGGTHYIKVTAPNRAPGAKGQYVLLMVEDVSSASLGHQCGDIGDEIRDPGYGCQWHLKNTGQRGGTAGEDINVEEAWKTTKGEGINVVIVDDLMNHGHEDLRPNIVATRSFDYGVHSPVLGTADRGHATQVAGVIAARDNGYGVVGVAPRANVYNYNYLTGPPGESPLVDALTRGMAYTAVSSNSWGFSDNSSIKHVDWKWEGGIERGITDGYGGKGTFYVWAAGNGGDKGDYANLGQFSTFHGITPVCAVDGHGRHLAESERGPNLWVCAPSRFGAAGGAGIATTYNDAYTLDFQGTSAAAPQVSGVAALMRAVNPNLTWRDVKLILADSARQNDPANSGWETGAPKYSGGGSANYAYSHHYGFGVVDAGAAVRLAGSWTNLPPMTEASARYATQTTIPDDETVVSSSVTMGTDVRFVEYVEVVIDLESEDTRDLRFELESPSGSVSVLLESYNGVWNRVSPDDFDGEHRLGSARHVGENPAGEWTLRVKDEVTGNDASTLESWSMTVYGHRVTPQAPVIASVIPGASALNVVWQAPDYTGASAVTAYDLRYIRSDATDKSDSQWTVVENAWISGDLEYTITGLEQEVAYDAQVRAGNDQGTGPWSTAVSGTTNAFDCSDSTATPSGSSAGLVEDCKILLAAKAELEGTGVTAPLNWATTLAIADWTGVTVGSGRVTGLRLKGWVIGARLDGTIPAGLGSLSALERLNLAGNDLTGSIPSALGSLTNLTDLLLSNNQLTGSIPPELGNLTDLEILDLSTNALTGGIPTQLGSLTRLTVLDLSHNGRTDAYGLSGPIPTQLGSLTGLTTLNLSVNKLTGSIPTQLESLTDLTTLELFENDLTGSIPTQLESLTDLTTLELFENDLSGGIPSELKALTKLETLALNENALTGAIPGDLIPANCDSSSTASGLCALEDLDLTGNALTAKVTVTLSPGRNMNEGDERNVTATVTLDAVTKWANGFSFRSHPTTVTLKVAGSGAAGAVPFTTTVETDVVETVVVRVPRADASATGTFTLETESNRIDENDETVTVSVDSAKSSAAAYVADLQLSGDDATILIVDNDTRGIAVSVSSLTVREGGKIAYSVRLNSQPTDTVTVTPARASGGSEDITLSPSSLTFTTADWGRMQDVTVSAARDRDGEDDTATITHSVSGGDYTGLSAGSVAVTVDDIFEGTTVTVAVTAPTTTQNGPFDISLTFSEPVNIGRFPGLVVTGTNVLNSTAADATAVNPTTGDDGRQYAKKWTVRVTPEKRDRRRNLVTSPFTASIQIPTGAGATTDAIGSQAVGFTPDSPPVEVSVDLPPTVRLDATQADVASTYLVRILFGENVSGLSASDFTVTNGQAGIVAQDPNDEAVYSVNITIGAIASGDVLVSLAANSVTDSAGQGNPAASVTIPIDRPTPTITGPDGPVAYTYTEEDVVSPEGVRSTVRTVTSKFTVTITFDQAVSGVSVDHLGVGNGTASNLTAVGDDSKVWTAEITPQRLGMTSVRYLSAKVTNAEGHGNLASNTFRMSIGTAPEFSAETASRSVAENSRTVGARFTTTDVDRVTPTDDPPRFSLSGEDAHLFEIGSNGQITVKAAEGFDFESAAKTTFEVIVAATDQSELTDTITVIITLTDVDEPPDAPTGVTVATVTETPRFLDVTWTAPVNTGRPDITGYDVQYREGASGSWSDGPQDVSGTSATITGLKAMTSYQAQVRASNDEGTGPWSGPGTGTTADAFDCSGSTATPSGSPAGLVADCEALLFSRDALRGTATLNWSVDTAIGSWDGVTVRGGRVVELNLANSNLDGTLPADLGDLSALVDLDLSDNALTGRLPPALSRLSNLELLHLQNNNLTGGIPAQYAALDLDEMGEAIFKLYHLDLTGNDLTGTVALTLTPQGGVSTDSISEGGGTQTVTVTAQLDPGSAWAHMRGFRSSLTVTVAGSGGTGVVSFTPVPSFDFNIDTVLGFYGEGSADFDLAPVVDSGTQTNETVTVSATGTGAVNSADITLTSNSPTLTLIDGTPANSNPRFGDPGTETIRVPSKVAEDTSETVEITREIEVTRRVAENSPAGTAIGAAVEAVDADGDTLAYTMSNNAPTSLQGDHSELFDIDAATGQIRVKAPLDYEASNFAVGGVQYSVTVSVSDGKDAEGNSDTVIDDTIAVTIIVTDVDEPGGAAFRPGPYQVGKAVSALWWDIDYGARLTAVMWERLDAADSSSGEIIAGATTGVYEPVGVDEGKWLRVTFTYNDVHGNGKRVSAVTASAVVAQ